MNRVVKSGVMKCSWGNIGYKHWNKGSPNKVFLMHGWLDNLGVFEPLVSHLSKDYEIFAFDLPGHGESDHVQWPWAYSHSDLPMYFHEIRQNVGWENFHVVAHSFSGNSMLPYLAAYPELTNSFVILDAYGLIVTQNENYISLHRKKLESMYAPYVRKEKYISVDELRKRMRKSSIPEEFQSLWMERGVKWNDDKTMGFFSRDIRLNGAMILPIGYSSSLFKEEAILNNYSIPTLRLLGKESIPPQGVEWNQTTKFLFDENVMKWIEKFDMLENVDVKFITGNHHFFVSNSESSADAISAFWLKKCSI